MNRRHFLWVAGVAGAGGCTYMFWPEQGVVNPCLAELPRIVANHEIVRAAWDGIDPDKVWDAHAQLLGTGDWGSGAWLSPRVQSLVNPVRHARMLFFLNAGCVNQAPGQIDQSYVERMRNLLGGMRPGAKLVLCAFDRNYTDEGHIAWERTNFYVPDEYASSLAHRYPESFEWAASIHPYRSDCVDALGAAVAQRARAVKWMPAVQNIDPASPRCDRFYAALARRDIPLITSAGDEVSLVKGDNPKFGNPLLLRRALDHGVRVVVAHCAVHGQARDVDQGEDGPWTDCFDLFARLMDEPRYSGRLYADISAMTQYDSAGPVLKRIIERTDWHPRLLNGTDYPLPGIMPLFPVEYLARLGLLRANAIPVLSKIHKHNPLLFDFVVKRHLGSGGKRLASSVFETRDFFLKEKPLWQKL
jgi:mannonate dehydratase